VQGRGQSLARVDLYLRGDLARGFAAVPAASLREEELELIQARMAAYGRRRAGALASGEAELARALDAKLTELAQRARTLRAAPVPKPPRDRPSLVVTFLPLGENVPQDRAVRALLDAHHAEVARRNLARARAAPRPCPAPREGAAAYVGTDEAPSGGVSSCKGCHPESVAHWQTTRARGRRWCGWAARATSPAWVATSRAGASPAARAISARSRVGATCSARRATGRRACTRSILLVTSRARRVRLAAWVATHPSTRRASSCRATSRA